ncbi:hypothetical protein BLX87_24170 [Bacillus sp. VT-16-64]|nr:hypothetical protein BLX87_24170 [Bacillus sp. VT-16-64]
MRICFLAPANSIHTIKWVNAFAAKKYEVHLLTIHTPDIKALHPKVKVHKLLFHAPVGYYLNGLQGKRLLNKIKPDLFHVHYASGYGTLGRLINFHPMILSVWGSDVFEFPYQSRFKEKTLKRNLQSADQILSTSYSMKTQTEKFFKPETDIRVTPFGVDTTKFKRYEQKESLDNSITIGMIKLLEPIYGAKYLIEAFAKILTDIGNNDENNTINLKLLFVGDGSEREALEQMVGKKGIQKHVEFVGAVPNDQVPLWLNRMDVFCAPSLSESFGVAVIEASACETPVVVSNVGGLPEVVIDEVTGFIVEPKHVEQLAEKILILVNDQSLRKQMGAAGRKFVLENYAWEKNVDTMESIYIETVTNK